MTAKPTGWNRLIASLQGEVPAEDLEAFRRASAPVFELLEQVERRRLECSIDGLDPWTVPPATRAAFLCAWNAFVLQTLGNDFLEADYRAEPRTAHFVPPVTAEQVLRFYEQVEGWVNRAWQAQANPDFRLDVAVPATLPAWGEVEPFPSAHLDGLLQAMRGVRDHADAAMAFLPAAPPADPEQQAQVNRIRQLYAAALARARYAEELCGHVPAPEVRERAGQHARAAMEQFYLLGQWIADPELVADETTAPTIPPPRKKAPRLTAPRDEPPRAAAQPTQVAPAAVAEPPGMGPPMNLITRFDQDRGQMVAETAETIDFTAQLRGETHFSVRLAQVSTPESRSVVLRVLAWRWEEFPMLASGTLTLSADAQNAVLRPLPDRTRRTSHVRKRISVEEELDYELPDGMLQQLCTAGQVGLRFKNRGEIVNADAATLERFQAYCRAFYRAIAQPADFLEGEG